MGTITQSIVAVPVVAVLLIALGTFVTFRLIAALLVRYLPARVLGVAAGGLIVLTNLQTLADRANEPPGPRTARPLGVS